VLAFFFKKTKAQVKSVQFFVAMLLFLTLVAGLILGKSVSSEKILLSAFGSFMSAVFVSFIAFVGTAGLTKYQSIPGILRSIRFGNNEEDVEEIIKRSLYRLVK
jgi:hypothetical protein